MERVVRVYRFEYVQPWDDKAVGIYDIQSQWITRKHTPEVGCPTLNCDSAIYYTLHNYRRKNKIPSRDDAYFGFVTKDQVIKWFSDYNELQNIFSIEGARFSIYQVKEEHVIASRWQAVFFKDLYNYSPMFNISKLGTFVNFITSEEHPWETLDLSKSLQKSTQKQERTTYPRALLRDSAKTYQSELKWTETMSRCLLEMWKSEDSNVV